MKHNEKGFSALEIALALIVIVLICGAGWYALKKQNDSSTVTKNNTHKAATESVSLSDSSKMFSFQYPDTWTLVPYVMPGHDGPAEPEPDWSKTPQPITLRNQKNKYAEIRITGYNDTATTIDKEIASITKDRFNTHSKVTINNYAAIKHVLDFVGPSNAEKYKDITYTILDSNKKVTFQFRERYSNATLNGERDFNASNVTLDFEHMVNSIKFNRREGVGL